MSQYQSIERQPLKSNEIISNRIDQINVYLNKVKEIYDQYQFKNLLQTNKHEYISIGKVDEEIFNSVLNEIDNFFREKKLFYLVKINDFNFYYAITCGCLTIPSEIKIAIPNQVEYMNKLYKSVASKQKPDMTTFYTKIYFDYDRDLYLLHNYKLVFLPLGYRIYTTFVHIVLEV